MSLPNFMINTLPVALTRLLEYISTLNSVWKKDPYDQYAAFWVNWLTFLYIPPQHPLTARRWPRTTYLPWPCTTSQPTTLTLVVRARPCTPGPPSSPPRTAPGPPCPPPPRATHSLTGSGPPQGSTRCSPTTSHSDGWVWTETFD